ncbi:MAG: DUF4369 domain-containing protein [Muribaculaceae bacterium]|nr:DUF4369 domain-containing protein [Muribaculaceae bacterium]
MKSRNKFLRLTLVGAVSIFLSAALQNCKKNEFRINGMIEGGAEKSVLLEKPDFHGRWVAMDSVKVNADGSFEIEGVRPSAPEIYRLSMDDRYIYLPVDSTETLTVNTKASSFGTDFTVTGSSQAEKMAQFEKELLALDFNDEIKRDNFKKEVYSKYLKDARGGIISYYVLTKVVGDKPLYDIQDVKDTKYYAAVATSYEQFRPKDPHAKLLRDASIEAMKRKNSVAGKKRVVEAEEIKMIDIELPDERGRKIKLSDVVGKGKKGILAVSLMNEKESPAINKALSDLHGRGNIDIYMVSLDEDQYAWRDAAGNLPWTTVSDPAGRNSGIITKYNVVVTPSFFIFNSAGELIDSAFSLEELNKKI